MSTLTAYQARRAWDEWLTNRNRQGMRVALTLLALYYPGFAILDYFSMPRESLPFLLTVRVVVTLYVLANVALFRTDWYRRHVTALSAVITVVACAGISAMLFVVGGLTSPYYVGIVLTVVSASLFFVWPARLAIVTQVVVAATYVLPNIFFTPGGRAGTAFMNVFFFGSFSIILAVGHILLGRVQYRQLITRLALERTKNDLERAHERLKEVDRYRTRFFANVTHELRTPLTLILSPVDAILQGQVGDFTEEQAEYLHGVQRNALKLLRLINDILDLVKLEDSHLKLDVTRIDVRAQLAEIVRFVQPLAERKDLTVALSGDDAPDDVWVDPEQFERVIVNLLSNAIKFTPEGGSVAVRLSAEAGVVRIAVEDTGVGIPADQLTRVFDRFTQVDDSATRTHGGTGIGLALAREIVDLHGGVITARSRLGHGTQMTVTLRRGRDHFREDVVTISEVPAEPGDERDGGAVHGLREWMHEIRGSESYRFLAIEQDTDRRSVRRDPKEQLKTRKVMVVDDNRDMLEFLQFQLHGRFRVYAATDGEMAWEIAKREKPDLIVSDYMMPGMDGMELCARVKADPETRHIPFVLLSAKAEIEDRVRGHESGADVYLAKPFRPRELHAVIDHHIKAGEAMADALLEKRMKSLDLLSAGLAHEIRNPLTYIQNGMFMLRQSVERWTKLGPDDAAGRDRLRAKMDDLFGVADKGVKRINGVVDLIKDYAQEGGAMVEREYAIDDAVRKTVPLLAPYRPKAFTIHQDLAAAARVWIVPEQLHQVLTGLVQNALDAIPDGGNIWLSTAREDGRVRLQVRDDGPGIPEDVRRDIFSPFFSTKAPGEGMGLGLTIVHRVVTRAGGTIEVDSNQGVGTLFTVEFPEIPPGIGRPAGGGPAVARGAAGA